MSTVTLGERLQLGIVRGIARLPPRVQILLAGGRPLVVDGQTMDPQLQFVGMVRRKKGMVGIAGKPGIDIARARRRFAREAVAFAGPSTPVASTRDLEIPGPGGKLRARHYAPDAPGAQPLLVFLHGGGFVFGDLETHDEPCRLLCTFAGTHVLSVDYRLAPEHPFPGALEDTIAALRWAHVHAASLGADPTRVTVGGDSAGANLATVAARLLARDEARPLAQLLIYPPTDAVNRRPSQEMFGDGYILTNADREMFTEQYTRGSGFTGSDDRISPLLAKDLGGLPPALVVTAGFDLLRDEGEAYADALAAAGSPAKVRRFPEMVHGFINLGGVCPAARRATILVARTWRALVDTAARQP